MTGLAVPRADLPSRETISILDQVDPSLIAAGLELSDDEVGEIEGG